MSTAPATDPGTQALSGAALAVTRHLISHGPSSRSELGKVLTLSPASMSRVARSLLADGVVEQGTTRERGVGRPRQTLSAVPRARHVVGVKLTGERAYGVLCDLFGTVVLHDSADLPAPVQGVVPLDAALEVVADLVRTLGAASPRLDGVGVGVGGVVTDHRTVQEAPFLRWYEVDLGDRLARRTGVPVVVSNDVTAFARKELWFGAGMTHSTFGVLTVGAGTGVGVVREGVVVDELIDNGRLLSHSPTPLVHRTCRHGHVGCATAYLDRPHVRERLTEMGLPSADLRDVAVSDDPGVRAVADDAARALGHLVATMAGALQTPRIVLAGEDVDLITRPEGPFLDVIDDRLQWEGGEIPALSLDLSVVPAGFLDWAQGAAVVALQANLGAVPGM